MELGLEAGGESAHPLRMRPRFASQMLALIGIAATMAACTSATFPKIRRPRRPAGGGIAGDPRCRSLRFTRLRRSGPHRAGRI
ncbi:MAG: hypothetical protein R3F11_07655 [Verrucomicrobiales bacterium]